METEHFTKTAQNILALIFLYYLAFFSAIFFYLVSMSGCFATNIHFFNGYGKNNWLGTDQKTLNYRVPKYLAQFLLYTSGSQTFSKNYTTVHQQFFKWLTVSLKN